MASRWLNAAIIVTWLVSMGWLIHTKVLPPLQIGDPPNYRSVIERQGGGTETWLVQWNGRPHGLAATKTVIDRDGSASVRSRFFVTNLPLADLAPGVAGVWLRPLLGRAGSFDLDAASRLDINPLGKLIDFETKIRASGIPEAIRVSGRVEGGDLELTTRLGEHVRHARVDLPSNSLLSDELRPQSHLPGLRLGQKWMVPVCAPLLPTNQPMEILQASVDALDRLPWKGGFEETFVVNYRQDPGAPLQAGQKLRGRLWVTRDGVVLQQETTLVNAQVRFVRLSEQQADPFARLLEGDWQARLTGSAGRTLLREVQSRDPFGELP